MNGRQTKPAAHRTGKRRTEDFSLINSGSVVLLFPHSDRAQAWCDEHLPEDRMTLGRGIAIEPRYVGPIVDGIRDAGLSIA